MHLWVLRSASQIFFRETKLVCVFRGWGLLAASHLCPKISKVRSIMLMAGVSSSSGFAFDHFYIFVNAFCMSALFACPFLIHFQFHLRSTFAVSPGTYYILDTCSLFSLNPVLLSSQGCNLLVTSS